MENNIQIFIINGVPTVGKDYIIRQLNDMSAGNRKLLTTSLSTVDIIKKNSEIYGYSEKTSEIKDKNREYIIEEKKLLDKHFDNFTKRNVCEDALYTHSLINTSYCVSIQFINARSIEDHEYIKEYLNNKGYGDRLIVKSLLVKSDDVIRDDSQDLPSDVDAKSKIMEIEYDCEIVSSRDEKQLEQNLLKFIEEEIKY